MTGSSFPAAAVSVDPGALVLAVLAWVALVAVLYVWLALGLSRVFRKVGIESWRAWVPVLNLFTLLELGGYTGWIALAALVPVGGIVVWVFVVLAAHRINRSFGYGTGMTVLAALVLPAWATVVGFGPARWLTRLPGHRAPAGEQQPPLTRRSARADDTVRPVAAAVPGRTPPPPLPTAPAAAAAAERAAASGVPQPGPSFAPIAFPPAPAVAGERAVPAGRGPEAPDPDDHADIDADVGATAVTWSPLRSGPTRTAAAAEPVADGAAPPEDWSRRARRDAASAAASAPDTPASAPLASVPAEWLPPAPPPGTTIAAGAPAPPPVHQPRYGVWAPDEVDDLPDEVSADFTVPGVGAPRAARSSVSAQHEVDGPDDEETVVVVRRRTVWELVLPLGPPVPIAGRCVILGRRPAPDPHFPEAQLVPIVDETRTVSKRHALLELKDDGWWIVDLDSTNGVVLAPVDDLELELAPGVAHLAGDRFLLGDAEVRLQRGSGG